MRKFNKIKFKLDNRNNSNEDVKVWENKSHHPQTIKFLKFCGFEEK